MSSQSSTEPPSVSETLGALYIGATIAAVYVLSHPQKYAFIYSLGSLYGITNLQGVVYYRRYPTDWWVYRYSVSRRSFEGGSMYIEIHEIGRVSLVRSTESTC